MLEGPAVTAFPNLHALAYGEGGQRLSAELRVEAADALERLEVLRVELRKALEWLDSEGYCIFADHPGRIALESATPSAHDKEKP